MTYDQYWYDDPLMVRAFYKAHKIRQEHENEIAWLNGVYTLNALRSVLSVSDLFRAKGSKPYPYPEKPFDSMNGASEERKKLEAENERLRLVARLNNVIIARKSQEK